VRFFLDHNINALVRKMLDGPGHECWTATQAGRRLAKDEDLAVYADDKGAVVVSSVAGVTCASIAIRR
jgi:hypothetical protein